MQSSFGLRLLGAFEQRGQLCIGLDPSQEQLHKWGLPNNEAGAEQLCNQLMEASEGLVGILKPQIAFFEQFGSAGFAVLEKVLAKAKKAGFIVIADAKRGDIGSTMAGYAASWLASTAPFVADALTVSPYLGVKSLEETVSVAKDNNKGVFILAATSNPEAKVVQAAVDGSNESVAGAVVSFASNNNQEFLGSVGIVLGAQTNISDFGIERSQLTNTPILAPGFGAQGAQLSDASRLFDANARSAIFNVSRSVAGDSPAGLRDRVLKSKQELEIGLRK